MHAYKGFNSNFQCRGFQFEVGAEYVHDGQVKVCASGFHACRSPFDVFTHYPPINGNRFAVVDLSGDIDTHDGDSNFAGAKISVVSEVRMREFIEHGVSWIMSSSRLCETTMATTGEGANAATTGHRANAATTGNYANAATTGHRANAATTGHRANAATTGHHANAATTGRRANAATTGYRANAATTGDYANAATTGYHANAATTGDYANAATTGDYANAATIGRRANAATMGEGANAATMGEGAIAAALGTCSKAKANNGGAIVLVYRDDTGRILHIKASKIGENGILPDVWYELNEMGEFVAVDGE